MLIWSIHRINGIKVAQVLWWWWWSIATWTCGHIIGAQLDDCSANVPNHSWYSVSVCSILFVVGGNDRPHQIQCLDRQAAEALMIVWWSGAPPSHWIFVDLGRIPAIHQKTLKMATYSIFSGEGSPVPVGSDLWQSFVTISMFLFSTFVWILYYVAFYSSGGTQIRGSRSRQEMNDDAQLPNTNT